MYVVVSVIYICMCVVRCTYVTAYWCVCFGKCHNTHRCMHNGGVLSEEKCGQIFGVVFIQDGKNKGR